MGRPEQHDTLHHAARRRDGVVGMGRHRAGIDVARMRHDQRLGEAEPRLGIAHTTEKVFHLGAERARVPGIEHPGHGSRSD